MNKLAKHWMAFNKALTLSALLIASAVAQAQTKGPGGETATPASSVKLDAADVAKINAGKYKAALLWHTSSDFINAVSRGAKDEFKRLGIEVVATTDASFDAAKQKSDVETVLAKKPNIILTLPLDPVSSAEAFRPAKERGVKLVFLSNVPNGYKAGNDYVAIVTDDLSQMGELAAHALAKSIGNKGSVAWLYHDAQYYVTNQRDQSFKRTITQKYPDIKIVAEQGISDPARAAETAQAVILKNPGLVGIYAPWTDPAEGVLSALRQANKKNVKLVTLDLSEPLALDMVKGGNTVALVADRAYMLGQTMAAAAALNLLNKPVAPFIVVPAVAVTKDNVKQGWLDTLNQPVPDSVAALTK
ncbi:MAG: substrate-binding domain-containing protein [Burkholderiaceae bacterium]|nr:substrate-binding domain-containing protein [Burkholderiaceae bacterium]